MLGSERQVAILEYIKAHKTATVKKLTEIFFASEATIRRDLNELEKTGIVRRVFGGATLVTGSDKQIPLFVRKSESGHAKDDICQQASTLLRHGQVIFIDGSSTAQFLLKYLYPYKDIIVITNGLKIAEALGELHVKTYLTGGLLMEDSAVFTGKDALRFIDGYNADICFLSCKGLSENGKFTDTSEEETELRRKFLSNSKMRVMLMTGNKIGKTYIHNLCSSEEIDYIFSDSPIPKSIVTRIKNNA